MMDTDTTTEYLHTEDSNSTDLYDSCIYKPSAHCLSPLHFSSKKVDEIFDIERTDEFLCVYDSWVDTAHNFVKPYGVTDKEGECRKCNCSLLLPIMIYYYIIYLYARMVCTLNK